MATLTWQDVAGQVRAPDYSEATELLTRGLGQISTAVQAPERLRQEKLDREMKGLMLQSEMNNRTGDMIDKIDTKLKNEVKERDLKEFSKNQSYLEANVRKAAMKGMALDDFLANDPIYKSMSEGAKSYSAANLSDAYMRGDETRIMIEERAKDDAYRAQRDRVQDAQSQRSYALAAENARINREERAALKAERDALKPKVWNTGNDKTDKAMTQMAAETGRRYIEASGARYATQDITSIGKNYKNLGQVSDIFNDVINKERLAKGKEALPATVLMKVLDTGTGSNNFWDGWNDIDDKAITKALRAAGDMYDDAALSKDYYERLAVLVDGGARPDQASIDQGWNVLTNGPKKPKASVKPDPVQQEITRQPKAGSYYDATLGTYVPNGMYSPQNPRPVEQPKRLPPPSKAPVRLSFGDPFKY